MLRAAPGPLRRRFTRRAPPLSAEACRDWKPAGGGRYRTSARGSVPYQLQHEVQQQLPPPHVVLAPGATWTNAPPVAVLPI